MNQKIKVARNISMEKYSKSDLTLKIVSITMGNDVGEDSKWMTRPDQSPDPLDGQVCCSAIPSANSQLFETYNLVDKGDVLDSIDDQIIVRIRTPKPRKNYWP